MNDVILLNTNDANTVAISNVNVKLCIKIIIVCRRSVFVFIRRDVAR